MPKAPSHKFNISYLLIALLGISLIRNVWFEATQVTTIPYSKFQQLLDLGQIKTVAISEEFLRGELKSPMDDGHSMFFSMRVEPELASLLASRGVEFTQVRESKFFQEILSWILPAVFFLAIWFYLIRRMGQSGLGGQFMSIGKSRAKVYLETDTRVTFADVAGVDEAKAELEEIVQFLKDPSAFSTLGARLPKGVLLVGPPGTGKTLLAKAVAGEAKVPFFSISGSEFVEMFVGIGAARVRDLFEQARQKAPCIIFIDELDALGRARMPGLMSGANDEKEQTLNQLLAELDGFDSSSGIVLLAATNRPEILDPALLRSGRFDRQVLVDKPDRAGRLAILKVHIRKIQLEDSLDLDQIAALTPGFSGADLANLVNEAALFATRRKAQKVTLKDFTEAMERIVAGIEKRNRLLNLFERECVAYHEMGHALVAAVLSTTDQVHKISIIPRGIGSLGYTIQRPTEDRYLMTKEELMHKMSVLLAGRAAEKLIFNHFSTGAADDLVKATDIAESMVKRYGMDTELGGVAFSKPGSSFLDPRGMAFPESVNYSPQTADKIDQCIRTLIDQAEQSATHVLSNNKEILKQGAEKLMQQETLQQEELKQLFSTIIREQNDETVNLQALQA